MLIGGERKEFERVKVDEFIEGEIIKVEERLNEHKKYKDDETGETLEKSVHEIRLVFKLDGYQYPHRSRWMTASMNENATFYKKYVRGLFEDAIAPDEKINTEKLVGIKVRTMWDEIPLKDGSKFQSIDKIRKLGGFDLELIKALHSMPDKVEEIPF